MRGVVVWMLATASLSVAATSTAQDSAASEALFNKGVALMEAGDYQQACPALEESQRLDPRPGTLFTLAECEAGWGRIASAVAHYAEYAAMVSRMPAASQARHLDRANLAEVQLKRLRPQVPQLTLVLPANAPKGTVVKRDGVVLSEVSLGMALPVDPGEHVIVTRVPGGRERGEAIAIEAGQTMRVDLRLELPDAPAPVDVDLPPSPTPEADSPSAPWAYVAGGVGVAGLATGAVTGIMAMRKKSTADDNCNGPVCNEQGLSATQDGKKLGNISTIAFGIGIAGLATGTILLLTAPSDSGASGKPRWTPTAVAGAQFVRVGLQRVW